MTKANATRGEVDLELEGVSYVLRPSWEAIDAIERQTGEGTLSLATLASEGRLPAHKTAIVAAECIRAWGRATDNAVASKVNAERVGKLMMEADGGLVLAMKRIELVLFLAATGGYTASGEVRPTAKATTTAKPPKTPAAG